MSDVFAGFNAQNVILDVQRVANGDELTHEYDNRDAYKKLYGQSLSEIINSKSYSRGNHEA